MGEGNGEKGVVLEGDTEMNLGSEKSFFDNPISKGIGLNENIFDGPVALLKNCKISDITSFDMNKPVSANMEAKPKNKGTINLFGR